MRRQNLFHLIGGYSVETAAERIELNQINVVPRPREISSPIQSRMVHPLIQHADRPVDVISVSYRGLRQHCKTERRNHLVDAVVDLRIQMVRSSRQNDGILVILFDIIDDFIRFFPNIFFKCLIFRSGGRHGGLHFRSPDTHARQLFGQTLHQTLVIIIRQKRMDQLHSPGFQFIVHIAGDDLRIHGYDRAVIMIVCPLVLDELIINARIENPLYAGFDERFDMAVHQFRRITRRIGGNRIHPLLIYFF